MRVTGERWNSAECRWKVFPSGFCIRSIYTFLFCLQGQLVDFNCFLLHFFAYTKCVEYVDLLWEWLLEWVKGSEEYLAMGWKGSWFQTRMHNGLLFFPGNTKHQSLRPQMMLFVIMKRLLLMNAPVHWICSNIVWCTVKFTCTAVLFTSRSHRCLAKG